MPVIFLSKLYGVTREAPARLLMLVITSERGSIGLLVEKIQGKREVVVQPLKDPFVQVPGINGGTELGDGKPVLILDGVALTNGNVKPLLERTANSTKQFTTAMA